MRRLILILCLTILPLFSALAAGQELGLPETYKDPVTGMQFVLVPGGTFVMGHETDRFAKPTHEVTVAPFYLGKYEVTFAEYEKYIRETGARMPDDEGWGRGIRPVINVNWHDASAFTQWLSKKSGRSFRLPSEAEWEYAARAGSDRYFPWGNDFGRSNANCDDCGSPWDGKQTAAVGSFSPNEFGLYDMAGNVYEWNLDTRHKSYEGAPVDGSAWLAGPSPEFRMNRGGSWYQPAVEMRTYRRCWDPAGQKRHELGFRVLLEP